MKLLLDTHIFLWLNANPEKLSSRILDACSNPDNLIYLSLVSPWEIQIKQQLGKLRLHSELSKMVETQVERNELNILPVKL
jgi:PIN domain nuclease of toxin-antitoxin system